MTDVWSLVADRTFVICFAFVMLTVKSLSRLFSPIIIPSYTSVPGSTKSCTAFFDTHDRIGRCFLVSVINKRTLVTSTDFDQEALANIDRKYGS